MVAHSPASSPTSRAIAAGVDRATVAVARHWLAVMNGLAALAVALPLAAAWLAAHEATLPARLIFFLFGPLCHQRPERSFHPWGEPMAICQRDTAIVAAALVAGLLYALLRERLRSLRWPAFLLLIAPLAIDGLTQLPGWRESTWELRVVTGALFGVAAIWLVYPRLEQTAADVRRSVRAHLAVESTGDTATAV
ncbi:MAG: DUF2085 domain-containing protein [Chloroflexi bacterium]|nr:DUF2085 domain-containing protein [Chloroflexota bacterium]